MTGPNLKTALPGPKAKALIDRDATVVSPSYTRAYPFVMARGEGALVEDVDGNIFLDCAAGIAVNSTGHSHPDVVRAIVDQAQRFLHMSGTDFYSEPQVRLAEEMASIVPIPGPVKSFFGNSGAEAIEAAIKLVRHATGRQNVIAFLGAFHGRTLGAVALTASKAIQRTGFGPLTPGVYHAPYADCYRCPLKLRPETCAAECLDFIEDQILLHLVGRDEVQSGMGRTGRMFACEHFDLEADVVTVAKGVASGMPLGVTSARADVMRWPPGAHASTFGGNPVCSAAALATITLLHDQLIANAAAVGAHLMAGLRDMADRHRLIGDVRGKGLMIGVELVRDRETKERATAEREAVVEAAFRRGVLLLGAGPNAVRFSPPLVLTQAQADIALKVFDEALSDVERAE